MLRKYSQPFPYPIGKYGEGVQQNQYAPIPHADKKKKRPEVASDEGRLRPLNHFLLRPNA